MCHSEPEEWDDGTEGRGFDRATTIGCARHFAGEFLGQMLHLNAFEGYDHVLAKSDFPTDENWSAAKKKEYAKSFSDIVHALNVERRAVGSTGRPRLGARGTSRVSF